MAKNLGKMAVLVGGGPAPGINGVIGAATIEAINHGVEVIGFRDGFKWLVQPDVDWNDPACPHCKRLTIDDVRQIHLRGGSILGTSRTNPTKSPESMQHVLENFQKMGIGALVTVGGDDTAYSAHRVYCEAGGRVRVAHVPKTIDNDLPLPSSTPTFGFETARQVGTYIVQNLAEDARTTSRWYIVVSMGRAAGHLALGIGKASASTLTIIPEEFRGRQFSLDELLDIILGSMIKRKALGRSHGVVVLAEGLIETIGEKALLETMGGEIGRYGNLRRDEHNHLRLGEIEFGRMVKDLLSQRFETLKALQTTLIDKDLGYELRCATPIPFDVEYTRNLGYGAVKFLRSDRSGETDAIIAFVEGRMELLTFDRLINPQTGRVFNRKVDADGESYECARRYMIRLEPHDFEKADWLEKLAATANLSVDDFRKRFEYLVRG